MKRYLGSLVTAVVVLVAAAVPMANARSGGGFSGSQNSGWHSGGGGWHGHDGGHFHNNFSFFFWGGPYWYPYSYWPPYYYYNYGYYYPPPYYYNYAPAYDYNYNAPRYYSDYSGSRYPENDGRDYLTLGHDAGKALKLKTASRDWLVEYMRFYIVNAPPSTRGDFRRGFISGYGEDGESVYKKAMQDVEHQAPPPPPPARSDTPPSSDATSPGQRQ